ncbi:hypothetical protein ACVWDG_26245, partial [Escherichia coli]|uniref:hypothetical protein n=2 Tax=Escherichia coli TaxID=562 RepID=UPI0024ACFAE3
MIGSMPSRDRFRCHFAPSEFEPATVVPDKDLDKYDELNRPGFPGECFICELRLPDHRFRWKHNKLFLLLPEEYGPAFP